MAYFQGVTFGGSGSPFQLRGDSGSSWSGLDMPSVRTGDSDSPRTHGQFIGLDLLSSRQIGITIDVGPPYSSYSTLKGAFAALRTALSPSGVTENPFFFQLSSTSPQLVSMVRPRKNNWNVDIPYVAGLAQTIPIQFNATDPSLYAAGTLAPSVGAPAPVTGFSFPIFSGTNLSFGSGVEYGLITATNSGDLPCYPLITFTGPCTTPTLANASISGIPTIAFGFALNAGDVLVVNTDPKYRYASYTAAGSGGAASRLYTLVQGSTWWALPPATASTLQFSTQDVVPVTGTCTVAYTSAYSAAN
jgi:hypothetical protein